MVTHINKYNKVCWIRIQELITRPLCLVLINALRKWLRNRELYNWIRDLNWTLKSCTFFILNWFVFFNKIPLRSWKITVWKSMHSVPINLFRRSIIYANTNYHRVVKFGRILNNHRRKLCQTRNNFYRRIRQLWQQTNVFS